jgi:hypothetical protein
MTKFQQIWKYSNFVWQSSFIHGQVQKLRNEDKFSINQIKK